MPRPKGGANAATPERRRAILAGVWAGMRDAGRPLSWREMAKAGEVGLATLSHHFGKRDDVVAAVLADRRRVGAEALEALATPEGDLSASVRAALDHMRLGLERYEVGAILGMGLMEGLGHERLGPAMLDEALEPLLAALEARLAVHAARGEMTGDVRAAALSLAAPLVMAVLHQGALGGRAVRPLDLDALCPDLHRAFLRGWAPEPVRPA